MTRNELAMLMEDVFVDEIMFLREQGQKEYAHDTDNAFANFERIADDLDLSREEVLWVYAMKHRDGIAAWIKGHRSQREDVTGRINDLIVYLFLLRGMIEEGEASDLQIPLSGLSGIGDVQLTPNSIDVPTDTGRAPEGGDVPGTVDPQSGDPLAEEFGGVPRE